MIEPLCNVVGWMPWLNFYSESGFIQVGLFITLFFFNQARTLFYAIVYMFLLFIWAGVFLAYYNVELFTGFLWVTEVTVFFIFILFLFYFNFSGELRQYKNVFWRVLLLLFSIFFFFFDDYTSAFSLLNFNIFFDDFYEALTNVVMNDIHALFLSYYFFNSFLLFIFGFMIFLASVVCINILKASRVVLISAITQVLSIYDFFKDLLNFEFLRKQNMFYQNLRKPTTRLVRKNSQEWFKKSRD